MKIRIMMFLIAALFLVSSAAAQKTLKMDLKVDRTTPLIKALTANEQAAWKHLVDKKYDDFGKFFADDYLGVYDTEMTTKTSEIAEDKQINFKSAAVTDIKVKVLDENNAIVTSNVKADMILPDRLPFTYFDQTIIVVNFTELAGAMSDLLTDAPDLLLNLRKIRVNFGLPDFARFSILHNGKDALNFVSKFQKNVQIKENQRMIVTTGNDVANGEIVQYLGIVRGIVVRATSIGAGFIGGLKALGGGNIEEWTRVCEGRKLLAGWFCTHRKWARTPLSECATTRRNLRRDRPKFSPTERPLN
jgi:hypothetical protein